MSHAIFGVYFVTLKLKQSSYQQRQVYLGVAENCNPGHASDGRTIGMYRKQRRGTLFYRERGWIRKAVSKPKTHRVNWESHISWLLIGTVGGRWKPSSWLVVGKVAKTVRCPSPLVESEIYEGWWAWELLLQASQLHVSKISLN